MTKVTTYICDNCKEEQDDVIYRLRLYHVQLPVNVIKGTEVDDPDLHQPDHICQKCVILLWGN